MFLLVLISVVQGQSLTSSEPVVKRPSESVTLSCAVSGFSMASYWTHWIRQKPGKGLEWIGLIDSGTGTIFAQSLQGQFTITKDSSKNQLYLEVKSLKTKDSAVYYCARDTVTKKLVSPYKNGQLAYQFFKHTHTNTHTPTYTQTLFNSSGKHNVH
ncbi:unnamed protein product [Oncorhynchus mykiss]|uniref:Ig-like domain-containing protein n=1 Tax=Oncorhynchus mykiss TaxID=8022 RepID=A0A060XYC1_ONCMY|nr:unnamed protein product [Oncorhynchus mykiss]